MAQRNWTEILEQAREIVNSYNTQVTLRQLYYRLVSRGAIPNNRSAYAMLSKKTAQARRDGTFPDLVDRTRGIDVDLSFSDPDDARRFTADIYRRDRTEGQAHNIFIGVEKDGLITQLKHWFGDYGVSIFALKGYCSQSFVGEIHDATVRDGRPAVLLYAGDYDPSGQDILRDFTARAECFDAVEQIALTREQVKEYDLPPMAGKSSDTRAAQFIEAEGALVQVEVDALPPDTLHDLYAEAFERYFDLSIYKEVLDIEALERAELMPA